MLKLIRELRRREVFRTVGLYVGISWILIEASSVVLPAFDAPEWTLRAIITIAIIGLPVTVVLAWVFDITEKGIEVQADPTETAVIPFGGRKADFVAIGVLVMALAISVYLNITGIGKAPPGTPDPVSVLIANFDNQTGDPLFDDSLEQALNIGLEGATFITAYRRTSAASLLESMQPGSVLDEEGARLVAIREGIKLVVSGAVVPEGKGFELSARVLNPEDGLVLDDFAVDAAGKLEVLGAVGQLADSIREFLGDESVNQADSDMGETFTATSLLAVKNYTQAQELAAAGRYEESIRYYEQAIAADGSFGRAYSGWALSLFYLGREEEATALWQRALTEMNNMTERERLRTLGLYYVAVAGDYRKAVESYGELVEKYPADNTGHNNMAIAYYFMLDFEKAMESAARGLEIYPTNKTVISNHAIFSMLAGEFDDAATHARELLADDPGMWKAWLVIAMERLEEGDLDGARNAYASMSKSSESGVAFAQLGLADIALFEGDYAAAVEILVPAIDSDAGGNQRLLGRMYLALAEARFGLGDADGTRAAIERALSEQRGIGQVIPAALLSLELDDRDTAIGVLREQASQIQPNARSYGLVIAGALATKEGRHGDAIDALRAGLELTDSWLLRLYLGRAYFEAGRYIEALDEFEVALRRRGEAAALFLDDDEPTWHYMRTLNEWLAKAREKANFHPSAIN